MSLFITLGAALAGCSSTPGTVDTPWMTEIASEAPDTSFGLAATDDGDVLVSGSTQGSVASDNGGQRDIFAALYGPDGTEKWSIQIGGPGNDSPLGVSSAPDGSFYMAGVTDDELAGEPQGSGDVWIGRFDADGNELWLRQFGGPDWDRGFDVTAFDGGAYVTGYTSSVLDPDTDLAGFDGYVARFTEDGDMDWIRQYGTDATDWGQGSSLAPDGGVYVTGYTEGDMDGANAGDKDGFVVRFSSDGDVVWTRQFGSAALDWAQGVGTTGDGGVLVAGSTEGNLGAENQGGRDAFVVSYNADGNLRFITQFGTSAVDSAFEVRELGDRAIASGSTEGDLGASLGGRDGFLVWIDGDGGVIDFEQIGSPDDDDSTGLDLSPAGDVFYSGSTFGQGNGDVLLGATTGAREGALDG